MLALWTFIYFQPILAFYVLGIIITAMIPFAAAQAECSIILLFALKIANYFFVCWKENIKITYLAIKIFCGKIRFTMAWPPRQKWNSSNQYFNCCAWNIRFWSRLYCYFVADNHVVIHNQSYWTLFNLSFA